MRRAMLRASRVAKRDGARDDDAARERDGNLGGGDDADDGDGDGDGDARRRDGALGRGERGERTRRTTSTRDRSRT